MAVTEVTNAQFREFVDATGYLTVAERPLDWEVLKLQVPPGTPKPPEDVLQPGSLVFSPPTHEVDLQRYDLWWQWTVGASWQHPYGPESNLNGLEQHPVVHIAFEDAEAYARWRGGRLPTESEWEHAARGGGTQAPTINVWGNEPIDHTRANIWTGDFPYRNTAADGFVLTAPVGQYAPNSIGLYDMAGNVWEWCQDFFHRDAYAMRLAAQPADLKGQPINNPTGPVSSHDPRHPYESITRVQRGGSFLCNDSYCASYRPSARMSSSPDSGLSHLGFRWIYQP